MTKAQEMRTITNKSQEAERSRVTAKHAKYAQKLVDRKIRSFASLGYGNRSVKISKRYSPTLTKNALELLGFEVVESRKNGRSIFKIKW